MAGVLAESKHFGMRGEYEVEIVAQDYAPVHILCIGSVNRFYIRRLCACFIGLAVQVSSVTLFVSGRYLVYPFF